MKYYLHSVDTMDDEKVIELFKEFGYEGTGLFHAILEKLAKQEKPIRTDLLKFNLKVGKRLEKCWSFMEEIGLISSNNGDTFNKQLLNYAEKYQIKKQKTAEKVSEWRKNQQDKESVTSYETISNHPKVKESKVNEIYIESAPHIIFDPKVLFDEMNQETFRLSVVTSSYAKGISEDEFAKYLQTYIEIQRDTNNLNRSIKDYRDHFIKWLRIELKNYQPAKKLKYVE